MRARAARSGGEGPPRSHVVVVVGGGDDTSGPAVLLGRRSWRPSPSPHPAMNTSFPLANVPLGESSGAETSLKKIPGGCFS